MSGTTLLVLLLTLSALGVPACGRSGGVAFPYGIRVSTRVVDAGNDVGLYLDMEIFQEVPHIAYYDYTKGDLRYARGSTGGWEISVVDEEGDVGGFPNLDVDQVGRPHIVYFDFLKRSLKYAYFNGLEWIVRDIVVPGEMEGFPGFQLDRNEIGHISTVGRGRYNLMYMLYAPDPFQPEVRATDIDTGLITTQFGGNINLYTTLLLRNVGGLQLPVILYYHASYGLLQLAYLNLVSPQQTEWVYRVLDGTPAKDDDDVGMYLSGWLEGNDIIHLAYFDLTRGNLIYGRYVISTNEFTKEAVDTEGIVGASTSIVLDSRNRPVISYYDATHHNLKVAVMRRPGYWVTSIADPFGVNGGISVIRPLPDGRLAIAYRDSTRRALKYAIVQTL